MAERLGGERALRRRGARLDDAGAERRLVLVPVHQRDDLGDAAAAGEGVRGGERRGHRVVRRVGDDGLLEHLGRIEVRVPGRLLGGVADRVQRRQLQLGEQPMLADDLVRRAGQRLRRLAAELPGPHDHALAHARAVVQRAREPELGRGERLDAGAGLGPRGVVGEHPVVLRQRQHRVEVEQAVTVRVREIRVTAGDHAVPGQTVDGTRVHGRVAAHQGDAVDAGLAGAHQAVLHRQRDGQERSAVGGLGVARAHLEPGAAVRVLQREQIEGGGAVGRAQQEALRAVAVALQELELQGPELADARRGGRGGRRARSQIERELRRAEQRQVDQAVLVVDVQLAQPHHVAALGGHEGVAERAAGTQLLEHQRHDPLGPTVAHRVVAEPVAARRQEMAERLDPVPLRREGQPQLRRHGPGVGDVEAAVAADRGGQVAGQALLRLGGADGVVEAGQLRRLEHAGLEAERRQGRIGGHVRVHHRQLQRRRRIGSDAHAAAAAQPLVTQDVRSPLLGPAGRPVDRLHA